VQTQRSKYLSFRRKFEPESVKLVIIAESPPDSGDYFYNPSGAVTEWLFAAFMKQLGVKPKKKAEGLREFQRRGWALIDATYEPVNKRESEAAKKEVILRDYPLLRDDLKRLLPDLSTPVLLVKANVCRLLEPKLTADGFNLINKGQSVSFPAFGQQPDFHRQFRTILKSAKTLTDRGGAPKSRRKKRPAKEIGSATPIIGNGILGKSKEILDYVIRKHGEEILTFITKGVHTAFQQMTTSDESTDMPGRTLHEAMQEVLANHEPRSASEIASEINRLRLYTRSDGGPVPAPQISARANKYPNLFGRAGNKICLA
jgi:hypothetical protein